MKVSFVKACGNEYMAQYDHNNIFFTRKEFSQRDKMVMIELAYGEVRNVKVVINKPDDRVHQLDIDKGTQFQTDPHVLIKAYAPLIEKV